jgi:proline iminopeptidase
MPSLYPDIEPYADGLLDVGDGNRLYWEASGNPDGLPAIVLHGGPGSGSSPNARRFFDPAKYRIILFDQRGSGQSTPGAGDFGTDLSVNTTEHLLGDIGRLRRHLGIARCLLLGHSWGTTLALAYAERHPEHVAGLVLIGVTTTRRSEIDWLYRDIAPLFPEQWARFETGAPALERHDLVAAYCHLLRDPDPAVRHKAAADWHDWEAATISIDPDAAPPRRWAAPHYRMARARIVTHYFHHNAWLDDGVLLREAGRLKGIPGVMVQGRLDLEAPLKTAWELSQAWPDGELVVVANAGHSAADAGMPAAIVTATDRLAEIVRHQAA